MVNQEKNFGLLLCEDLLANILCRLPVKDLLKCKCVSKEWLTVVSHVCIPMLSAEAPVSGVYYRAVRDYGLPFVTTSCPQDAKDQLQHLVAYSDSIHYVDSAPLKPHLIPITSSRSYSDEKADSYGMSLSSLLPFDHRGPSFLDCCNGLVLFVQRPKPLFYVCNPAIGQCVSVPLPPPSIHLSSLYASLAFDPSESIHYRVVISSLNNQPQCLHLFDSQTGEWKTHEVKIELPPFAECFKLVRHSIYLTSVVYRLSMYGMIISFDLKFMKACVINCPSQKKSPPTNAKDQPPPGCIGASNGSLSYVRDEDGYVCVWLLDNPNDSSEWSLKHKICLQYLWKYVQENDWYSRYVWLRCCAFHPTSDILFMGSACSIFMYHIGNDCFEPVRYLNITEAHCGDFFPIFLHKNICVTLKDWCRGITTNIDNYEDIHDRWCYTDQ